MAADSDYDDIEVNQRSASVGWMLAILVTCPPATDEPSQIADWTLQQVDTLATAEQDVIGVVADLIVGADRRLWIADPANHQLVVYEPPDRSFTTVSRQGAGPGELETPYALAADNEDILVLDAQFARISRISAEGKFIDHHDVRAALMRPLSLTSTLLVAVPTLGLDSSLVARIHAVTGEQVLIGKALAQRPSVMSMTSLREQALRRVYPEEFKNNVLPLVAADGRVWIISQYTGTIEAFHRDGGLAWTSALEPDLVTAAHDSYFDAVQAEPGRVRVPSVATHAELVMDELWIMLAPARDRSEVLRLSARDGRELGRILLPGLAVGPFAVDPPNRIIYLNVPDEALLLSVKLPEALFR